MYVSVADFKGKEWLLLLSYGALMIHIVQCTDDIILNITRLYCMGHESQVYIYKQSPVHNLCNSHKCQLAIYAVAIPSPCAAWISGFYPRSVYTSHIRSVNTSHIRCVNTSHIRSVNTLHIRSVNT